MTKEVLDEREFELVNIIGGGLASNQRDLSQKMSLSLGMTNMLIRRLVSKGFIRINQLNKRKVKYILTTQGFAEKMRKSVKYTFKTLVSIGLIKDRIKKIILGADGGKFRPDKLLFFFRCLHSIPLCPLIRGLSLSNKPAA